MRVSQNRVGIAIRHVLEAMDEFLESRVPLGEIGVRSLGLRDQGLECIHWLVPELARHRDDPLFLGASLWGKGDSQDVISESRAAGRRPRDIRALRMSTSDAKRPCRATRLSAASQSTQVTTDLRPYHRLSLRLFIPFSSWRVDPRTITLFRPPRGHDPRACCRTWLSINRRLFASMPTMNCKPWRPTHRR